MKLVVILMQSHSHRVTSGFIKFHLQISFPLSLASEFFLRDKTVLKRIDVPIQDPVICEQMTGRRQNCSNCLSNWPMTCYRLKIVSMIRKYHNHKLQTTGGTMRKSHTTIMRHWEDKQSKGNQLCIM